MDRISDKRKCMASLAVFRDLYDQKKDIYVVIAEFVKLAIAENALSCFELQTMVNLIKKDYGFDLPVAVIKRAIGKLSFLEKNKTSYSIKNDAKFDADEIRKNTYEEDVENRRAIESLNNYVEKKKGVQLSEQDKNILCNEFCAFVIDDSTAPTYGEYISQFIIEHTNDKDFVEQLNQIRQGVVIYVGLNYNADYNNIDKLDTALYIYLDTEIIFHMFGLNGLIYKELFDEFYSLVEEINKKTKKEIIKLRYFAENEDEINAYFRIAERIVRKEEQLDPSKQAMCHIVNGCVDAYQVVEKKSELFDMLKSRGITLDSQEHYYDKEVNHQFIIDSRAFYEDKEDDVSEKDIDRKVNLLNYISIKRGFKSQKVFRNVGHILLSANKITFNIAFAPSVREDNCVPLATNLSFLTNRFWLVLNKGLANLSALHSINIITKAQIALSSRINDNVGKLYAQFIEEDKSGKFDTEKKKATLAELHKSTVSPDDLNADNSDDYVNVLSIQDINTYIAEMEIIEAQKENEHQQILQEMKSLKGDNKKLQEEQKSSLEKAAKEILSNRNEKERKEHDKQMTRYIESMNADVSKHVSKIRRESTFIVVLYLIVILFLFVMTTISTSHSENTFIQYFFVIIELLCFSIPFIRPLWKHECISNAFKYCIKSSYRDYVKNQYEIKYRASHIEPELHLTTFEDVMIELENH